MIKRSTQNDDYNNLFSDEIFYKLGLKIDWKGEFKNANLQNVSQVDSQQQSRPLQEEAKEA